MPSDFTPAPAAQAAIGLRDVAELQDLRTSHPELAPAVDLQLQLLDIQRRVLPRISLPAALLGPTPVQAPPTGRALLHWAMLPIGWSDFRAVLRETTEALLRSGNVEPEPAAFLTALAREGNRLPAFIEGWFRNRFEGKRTVAAQVTANPNLERVDDGALDGALLLALKPFLVRCAEAIAPRLSFGDWQRGTCPLCSGEPELAVASAADHLLVCGQCGLRWPFPSHRCTYCESSDPETLKSFTSADRVHLLQACDRCRRYLKVYDERHSRRPAMPGVDTIAMLGLDAVAYQRGYSG